MNTPLEQFMTRDEAKIFVEAARVALTDPDIRDYMAEKLGISQEQIIAMRDKIKDLPHE